jgi:hypothetical protein
LRRTERRSSQASGTWTISYFLLVDQVGNAKFLDATQLTAAGHPEVSQTT